LHRAPSRLARHPHSPTDTEAALSTHRAPSAGRVFISVAMWDTPGATASIATGRIAAVVRQPSQNPIRAVSLAAGLLAITTNAAAVSLGSNGMRTLRISRKRSPVERPLAALGGPPPR